jgi:hypothetical protein
MAGEMTNVSSKNNRGIQGLGFASGVYLAYDCMSTLNSSPWTHETFGGEPGKAESAQRYVRLAIIRSTALAMLTSFFMGSITPLIGASVANADLFYIYHQAGSKATAKGH